MTDTCSDFILTRIFCLSGCNNAVLNIRVLGGWGWASVIHFLTWPLMVEKTYHWYTTWQARLRGGRGTVDEPQSSLMLVQRGSFNMELKSRCCRSRCGLKCELTRTLLPACGLRKVFPPRKPLWCRRCCWCHMRAFKSPKKKKHTHTKNAFPNPSFETERQANLNSFSFWNLS